MRFMQSVLQEAGAGVRAGSDFCSMQHAVYSPMTHSVAYSLVGAFQREPLDAHCMWAVRMECVEHLTRCNQEGQA